MQKANSGFQCAASLKYITRETKYNSNPNSKYYENKNDLCRDAGAHSFSVAIL